MDTNPKMETNLKQSLFSDDQKIFSQDDLKSRSISLDHRKTVRESDVNSETDGYFWSGTVNLCYNFMLDKHHASRIRVVLDTLGSKEIDFS